MFVKEGCLGFCAGSNGLRYRVDGKVAGVC